MSGALKLETLRDHLRSLASLVIRGDEEIHYRKVRRLRIATSDTSWINSMEFDLSAAEAERLWETGREEMSRTLAEAFPNEAEKGERRSRVVAALQEFHAEAQKLLQELRGGGAVGGDWLRANVFVITDIGKTGIEGFQYNMDGHPDRDFEFPLFGGGTGTAFARRTQVISPLYLEPQDEYRGLYDSYEQLVERLNIMNLPKEIAEKAWPRLKTILSTPVFDPEDPERVVGILNLDTCCTLGELPFDDETVLECARGHAVKMGELLLAYRFKETRIAV